MMNKLRELFESDRPAGKLSWADGRKALAGAAAFTPVGFMLHIAAYLIGSAANLSFIAPTPISFVLMFIAWVLGHMSVPLALFLLIFCQL